MDLKRAHERLTAERTQRATLASKLRADKLGGVGQRQLGHMLKGSETFERHRDLTALLILEGELHDIDDALRRMEQGSYGDCEQCSKPIGDERLDAKPWARYCIVHQAEADKAATRR
ncbi:MAG TPA: TraR/DksA C4-type zinc finger protein [Candidatus Dormibacteraeota bacterium]